MTRDVTDFYSFWNIYGISFQAPLSPLLCLGETVGTHLGRWGSLGVLGSASVSELNEPLMQGGRKEGPTLSQADLGGGQWPHFRTKHG